MQSSALIRQSSCRGRGNNFRATLRCIDKQEVGAPIHALHSSVRTTENPRSVLRISLCGNRSTSLKRSKGECRPKSTFRENMNLHCRLRVYTVVHVSR